MQTMHAVRAHARHTPRRVSGQTDELARRAPNDEAAHKDRPVRLSRAHCHAYMSAKWTYLAVQQLQHAVEHLTLNHVLHGLLVNRRQFIQQERLHGNRRNRSISLVR